MRFICGAIFVFSIQGISSLNFSWIKTDSWWEIIVMLIGIILICLFFGGFIYKLFHLVFNDIHWNKYPDSLPERIDYNYLISHKIGNDFVTYVENYDPIKWYQRGVIVWAEIPYYSPPDPYKLLE